MTQQPTTETDDEDAQPLEDIVTADQEDRPDEIAVGDATLDVEEFLDTVREVKEITARIQTLQLDLDRLRHTGLAEDDVVDLLYGRNPNLTKGTIRTVLDTLGEIDGRLDSASKRRDTVTRLVADLGSERITDSEHVLDELRRLHDEYGDELGEDDE